MVNKYFKTPFAENGDKTVIDNTTPDGEVSYDSGYTSDYEIDKDVNPVGARDVERRQFNQLMNDITGNLKSWQENGFPEWIADSDGLGNPFSYPFGATVTRNGIIYQSKIKDNKSDPEESDWIILSISGSSFSVETFQDLESLTPPEGLRLICRERAGAEYIVTDGTYVPQPGDATFANGLHGMLQLKFVNDLRWWGAVGDYDEGTKSGTDSTAAIQSALDRADGTNKHVLTGAGLLYLISTGLVFNERNTEIIEFTFGAATSWDAGTIDYTDMGSSAGGAGETQVSNRGNPMIRMWRRDTSYTGEQYRRNALRNFKLLCNDVAPGICMEETRKATVEDFEIFEQFKYGIAWLVKNTESEMLKGKVYETGYGTAKQSDPNTNPYNSAGIVQTCADVIFDKMVSNYSQYPLWVDGFFNSQMSNIHLYNGNGASESLPNAYIGPNAHGLTITNLYNDNGFLEMHSFNHTIGVGRFAKTSASTNTNFAVLVAGSPTSTIEGLNISGISGGHNMISLRETGGNEFTAINNCYVPQMLSKLSTAPDRSKFLTNKVVRVQIQGQNFVADGAVWRYDYDMSSITIKDTIPSRVIVSITDKRTNPNTTRTNWYKFDEFGTSKILSVYTDLQAPLDLHVIVNDGFNYLS